jgi:hypothetical protein
MRKNRNKLFIILFCILIISCFIFYFGIKPQGFLAKSIVGHIMSVLINLNEIQIQIDETLIKKDVTVIWSAFTGSNTNEFKYSNRKIFEKNKEKSIPSVYGINNFSICYQNVFIGDFYHFKENNWNYHMYKINLFKQNKIIKLKAEIFGQDANIKLNNIFKRCKKNQKNKISCNSLQEIKSQCSKHSKE